jgi:hypothetical protein
VWALCTSGGSGLWFEPYCGRDTCVEDKGLGQGPNVVLQLVEKTELPPGSELYFDNLFTSFPLLERLSEMNIVALEPYDRTGKEVLKYHFYWTYCPKLCSRIILFYSKQIFFRLHKVPIVGKKDLRKKTLPRGHTDVLFKDDQVLIGWKDN